MQTLADPRRRSGLYRRVRSGTGLPRRRQTAGLLLGALLLVVTTVVLVSVRETRAGDSALLVYLLVVVVVAVAGGLQPALLSALAGFLLANWFLTEPFETWHVGDPAALVDLVVFILVAVVVSVVVEVGARDRALHQASRSRLAYEEERARQLAETDRVRSALLAAVSHDLRTPIASIKAAASGLRGQDIVWTAAERAELLAGVEEGADRLSHLVEDLLDMSRIQAGALSVHPRAVSLDEVVYRAVLGYPAARVQVDVPDLAPTVLADAALLERAVANLVDNAVRFTPDGQRVQVGLEERSHPPDGAVRLHVTDHGPGVDVATWETMFRPFQRLGDSGHGGVGLGLAIAKGLVEAMGGQLEPSATPGGGLTMTVVLRAAG